MAAFNARLLSEHGKHARLTTISSNVSILALMAFKLALLVVIEAIVLVVMIVADPAAVTITTVVCCLLR